MSVNSSNDSLLRPDFSSTDSYLVFETRCFITPPSSLIYVSFFIANIVLLLPLSSFILYLGLQRWRLQRRSSSSTAPTTSHSDIFTFHMVAMEMISVPGYTFCCCGIFMDQTNVLFMGFHVWSFIWLGETFFHMLTCVERYLAVIHPITYRSLRGQRGIRIRNVSIGSVWVFCLGGAVLTTFEVSVYTDLCVLIFCLLVTSVCSVSVLCVLIRPGPGERGGDRERVGLSKLRAFYTVILILAVLLLRCAFNIVWVVLMLLRANHCVLMATEIWFNLPFSLVLPLLFLHRAGMLACCRRNTK